MCCALAYTASGNLLPFFSACIAHTTSFVPLVGKWPIRRDPTQFKIYLESTQVLTSNNNERPALHKNETYTTNLAQLDALVFTQERTVSRQDIRVRVVLPYLIYINAVLEM